MSNSHQERFSIVVVDDDDIYRDFVTAVISAHGAYTTFDAPNGSALCEIIERQQIDCIVLDYNIGDENGFSIKELLHAHFEKIPPIVMLTGDETQSTVINALRSGFADYVPKHDMNPAILFSAIGRAIEKDRCGQQAEAERRRLRMLATRDGLTGLANRREFDETLAREYKRTAREKTKVALIMLDVDRFKSFNDRYGHPAGDACLKRVSYVIGTAIYRPGDTAARYGGEEFAIILPNTDEVGAATIADRIRRAISDLALPHHAGIDRIVTISAGVASVEPDSFDGDALTLVQYADRALYAAKDGGRNAVANASDLPALLVAASTAA